MKTLIQIAALAASVCAVSFAAHADTELTVDFTYDATAPAAQVYVEMADTAHRSCRKFYRGAIGVQILTVRKRVRACRAEIADLLVKAIDDPAISSIHHNRTIRKAKFARSSFSNRRNRL